jgi:hypothetical protein
MTTMTVPVIYDRNTKQILRWGVLDFDYQLNDPAFNPRSPNEGMFRIPLSTYRMLAGSDPKAPLLHKLQGHINSNAP